MRGISVWVVCVFWCACSQLPVLFNSFSIIKLSSICLKTLNTKHQSYQHRHRTDDPKHHPLLTAELSRSMTKSCARQTQNCRLRRLSSAKIGVVQQTKSSQSRQSWCSVFLINSDSRKARRACSSFDIHQETPYRWDSFSRAAINSLAPPSAARMNRVQHMTESMLPVFPPCTALLTGKLENLPRFLKPTESLGCFIHIIPTNLSRTHSPPKIEHLATVHKQKAVQ